ncbi:unnamed protein product [Ectocarpus sp. 8 AP-2014]
MRNPQNAEHYPIPINSALYLPSTWKVARRKCFTQRCILHLVTMYFNAKLTPFGTQHLHKIHFNMYKRTKFSNAPATPLKKTHPHTHTHSRPANGKPVDRTVRRNPLLLLSRTNNG